MSKLSKHEIKQQKELLNMIKNTEKLTFEQIETFYKNFNEGYLQDVTEDSLYCTPLSYAYDVTLLTRQQGVILDICAGMGVLTHAYATRMNYYNSLRDDTFPTFICIEKNPRLVEIGKKLCPYAHWIVGDCFDEDVYKDIITKYKHIDHIISNPPFGTVTKISDKQKQWCKYTGKKFEFALLEIALKFTNNVTMIVPLTSVEYIEKPYVQQIENKEHNKLRKQTGLTYHMEPLSLEIDCYEEFKNTKIKVTAFEVYDE